MTALLNLTTHLQQPGEHSGFLSLEGRLVECILTIPDARKSQYFAMIGHPHSLKGGTMHNKIVTTLMRVFRALGIASLRFNFRGVGHSQGAFDGGIGESEDMLALLHQIEAIEPKVQPIFSGFSFGAFVAYRAAAQKPHPLLITIAPAVNLCTFDIDIQSSCLDPNHWLLIQGDSDEIVPPDAVHAFAKTLGIQAVSFEETGHFFHGQLVKLRDVLSQMITQRLFL